MNLCKAYRNNNNSRIVQIGQTIKFSLAVTMPIITAVLTLALVHAKAPVYVVQIAAIFGMTVAILVLFLTSLDLSKEKCGNEESITEKLITCFIISLVCVICQAIFLIYYND